MINVAIGLLSALGALLGGIAAWRSRGVDQDRRSWERLFKAQAAENQSLRNECVRLRAALRSALRHIRELTNTPVE